MKRKYKSVKICRLRFSKVPVDKMTLKSHFVAKLLSRILSSHVEKLLPEMEMEEFT